MKRYSMTMALFIALSAGLSAQGITGVQVKNGNIKKKGPTVSVNMQLDLTNMQVGRQRSVVLEPVIVASDGSREQALQPVVVDGRVRHRVHLRQEALTGRDPQPDAYTTVLRRNGEEQTVDYGQQVAYEPWMADSRLELRETLTGCAECGEGSGTVPVSDRFVTLYQPTYVSSWLEPDPEPVKQRAKNAEARIQFRQDKYDILPDYKGNRSELQAVTRSVNVVYEDPDVTITGISITGYASPEGSVKHNKELSYNRANALLRYIVGQLEVSPRHCTVTGEGEDWTGLRREVEAMTTLPQKDRVLQLIDEGTADRDACEQQIKALQPKDGIYGRLYTEVYPRLRRNEYRIEYNVRNFSVEEAKAMMKKDPSKVSLTEMYRVAGTYPKDSREYAEALSIAAATYPDQPAALNNAALSLLDSDRAAEAVSLLSGRAQGSAPLLNTLGVAYARTGKLDRARQCFNDASVLGSEEGRKNLTELDRYLEEQ